MIAIVDCSDAVEISQLDYMRFVIRKERWEAALSKYNKMDQILMIVSEYMLHQFVKQEFGINPACIKYHYNCYGKPQFLAMDHIKFNISHAGSLVAIAISDHEIGIDIEQIVPLNYDFVERYFTYDEQRYISLAPDKKTELTRFYEIWTCKESYVKMLGTGLNESLTSFSIDMLKNRDTNTLYSSCNNKTSKITSKCYSVKTNLSKISEQSMPKINIRHTSRDKMQLAFCTSATNAIPCYWYELLPHQSLNISQYTDSFFI